MKIRWYHWMVYRLFVWMWNPIFRSKPHLTRYFVDYMEVHIKLAQNDNRDIGDEWNDHLGKY